MISATEIEKSLITKYRKDVWSKFVKGIKEYSLINSGDKVAVAISGGKDSLLLAKLIQELQKYGPTKFEAIYIVMDPGFSDENRTILEQNCKLLNVPIKVKNVQLFTALDTMFPSNKSPCYMCARMRRGILYSFAKEHGCNKLALGHHFDDFIGTTLLNLFYASEFKTMLPKIKSANFADMELIRPLLYVRENSIIRWKNYINLQAMDCGCTLSCSSNLSKRREIKNLLQQYKQINENVENSIFQASQNVNLDAILGFRKDNTKYSYLDYLPKQKLANK